jgi:hypothetical protein
VADGAEQLTRRALGRQLGERPVNRPEPDDEVVPVVAVAQGRVEPGEVVGMPLGRDATPLERGSDGAGIDRSDANGGSGHGRRR